jgi:uncharacterized Zn finger protein
VSNWFPRSSGPLPVAGGLKARSTRGAIGETWWSGRFVAILEEIIAGGRLQRGRNYARRGQVISLGVAAGMVTAEVQGSRAEPYQVSIGITPFVPADWAMLERALAGSAWYSAKLLAGEMPEDIEEVFEAHGLPLFPAAASELSMDCSCPDWQVPCKHIAATFYLLAEAFDDDPFLILAWRGRDRDDLLASLHAARRDSQPAEAAASAGLAGPAGPAGAAGPAGPAAPPLADCLESYFALAADLPRAGPAPAGRGSVLGQLPPVDVAVRNRTLTELLEPAYDAFGSAERSAPAS